VPLSQWQYDALVSFTFNLGKGNFDDSTLLVCLNKQLYAMAANEFMRWVYVGKEKMAGLMARRRCEKVIFRAGS
jgi:GH24 family phage-related lysozyme (muramidase)